MDTTFIVFVVLAFISVVFLLEAVYFWYQNTYGSHSRRIQKRLQKVNTGVGYDRLEYQSIVKKRYSELPDWLVNLVQNSNFFKTLDEWTYQSGLQLPLLKFIQYSCISSIVLFVLALLLGLHVFVTLLIALLGLLLPTLFVLQKRKQRLRKIELQLTEAIDAMTRSLRAGQTIQTAFQLVAEELPDPIASEFRIFIEEINLGANFNDALQNLALRIPLTDMKYLVIAMLVQRDTGGNLFEILSSINKVIRERFKLQGEIRVLSAEGRASALVLCALPVIMFFVSKLTNAKQMDAFVASEFGQQAMMYGAFLMLMGVVAMMRITKMDY